MKLKLNTGGAAMIMGTIAATTSDSGGNDGKVEGTVLRCAPRLYRSICCNCRHPPPATTTFFPTATPSSTPQTVSHKI